MCGLTSGSPAWPQEAAERAGMLVAWARGGQQLKFFVAHLLMERHSTPVQIMADTKVAHKETGQQRDWLLQE